MDIGFVAVYDKLTPFMTNTFCYYKDGLLKSDINGYKAEVVSSSIVDTVVVTRLKLTGSAVIKTGFLIDLTNKYYCVINDIYERIKVIGHTSDIDYDYIDCIDVPTSIIDGTEELDQINLQLISSTKFSYGKFEMAWKPRGMCLFEGINIDIETSTKDDEDRDILDSNVKNLLSVLLSSTSFKIDSNGNIGYFKIIGRPSIRKGTENGKDVQSTIVSFSGYYQINYNN